MGDSIQLTTSDHQALTRQLNRWEGFLSTGIGARQVPNQMRKAFANNEVWQRFSEVEAYKAAQQELATVPLNETSLTGRVTELKGAVTAIVPQATDKEADKADVEEADIPKATVSSKGLLGLQIGLISTLALFAIGATATAFHRAGLTARLSSLA